ncbi:polysaccharide biosynthesis tyrosine autokinase [Nocardioides sp. Soil805]|uniref:polysaccharide biosynthesis tyrosine autokinase n=1 Tax=Nocardioides sp. Soil805 TaxID=1736416 RepID=UPI000703020F|nr:polysaccharide biosynthesis tyrosine autokinase [Nocardioides sp. Soil805]KRF35038.1 hypothetical protein ASG94_12970 [Nocardioides sp. Soil805]
MDLADYLRVLRDHWIAITATTIACAVAAFVYSSVQPQVYVATTSGFVTSGPGGDPNLDNINDVLGKSRAASYVGLAKDRETASLVIEDLDLDTTPEALVGNIDAAQTPETVLVNVSARASTPDGAKELADAWISALAERVSDVESGGDNDGLRLEVSDSALLPSSPVSPNVARTVLLGALLGAILGIAYAFVRTLLDRRLRSLERVESTSGVAVVGSLPELDGASGLFVTAQGADLSAQAAEEVRRMRTNLSYMDAEGQPRSVVVTSANHGDGKTTVALNLAAAIALTGQRVTVIDADLRGSGDDLAHSRGLDDGDGLTEVLTDRARLDTVLRKDPDIAGLSVLTAGHRPSNPSEILGSDAMRSLIAELSGRGMVIIDAPPLLPVTDAAIVAHLTDGALVVVSAGGTRDDELKTAIEHLHAVRARPLGIVLNQIPRRTARVRGAARRQETPPVTSDHEDKHVASA